MAWTAPRTWVTAEVVTASIMNTDVRDNFLQTGPAKVSAVSQILVSTAANTLVARGIVNDEVITSETTASTSYTDLATSGPAVTATTGTSALVLFACRLTNQTVDAVALASYAVSSASTVAASDNKAIEFRPATASHFHATGYALLQASLTAGSNVFTMKYRVASGTGEYARRRIAVVAF